jgi:hypothetical protein
MALGLYTIISVVGMTPNIDPASRYLLDPLSLFHKKKRTSLLPSHRLRSRAPRLNTLLLSHLVDVFPLLPLSFSASLSVVSRFTALRKLECR